ncbi:MAG: glycosyltransferase family 39 protein, partial [Chloroflexota bacterium]
MSQSKRYYYVIAVFILLVAAGVRLWDLPTLPVGFSDPEIANVGIVREDIWQGNIRVFYTYPDVTAPYRASTEGLYHMVLATASLLFGEGTLGLRMLSVFANMLTVALLYTLGRRLFGGMAGLMAAGLYTAMMWAILLSRLVIVETTVPLMVTAVMLALARALPVYERVRIETSNTRDFAVMGCLISLSLYLHASSLFVVLMAMSFVVYIMVTRRPLSLRRLSYIGFAILMLAIVALPYAISTARLPDLSANSRIAGADGVNIIINVADTILGIFWQGDSSAALNLPQRPLVDFLSGFIMLLGLVVCVQRWRDARYALVLIAGVILVPPAALLGNTPNFIGMSTLLPVIVLLFSAGAMQLVHLTPKQWQRGVAGIFALLIAGNLVWSVDSLFNQWHARDDVYTAYNGDIGTIAHHFDLTADEIPVVICNPEWEPTPILRAPDHDIDLVRLHMNNDTALIREVDCRNGFVFVNAGLHQQVLVAEPMTLSALSPAVADWLALSTPMPDMPVAMVFDMQVQP